MRKRIVFIGDSITHWMKNENDPIGTGYVRLVHDYLQVTYPEQEFEIFNEGLSGNRVTDLAERWEQDVLSVRPDFVSISIGINDVWRQLDSPDIEQVYHEQFEKVYESLLLSLKEKTNARIILMEPTVIAEDVQSEGNVKLAPYVEIVHKLAERYSAVLVPTHEAFISYLKTGKGKPLTLDGVHMNSMGNMLMAKTWVEAAGKLFEL
ncbi:SGNH/GDSL hydrolase family protein [Bacillus sp. B-jedd]|uniref:SGNH/GDSL hydrolase family protein n=1 Tax=Bacillus sp. B-jedd TaxID=1476857 RepID=UPI00051557B6|nr:SGNH/GDSL hydrolase family protein [Bacillus sp. B-jedd]CEG26449.1 G-D-S-L family lipolytic protein [Bacillus sp. B-jedd]